jgi:hypothetical protein
VKGFVEMTNSSPYVFMSYRSSEAEFALRLTQDIRAAGIHVWMDQLKGIKGGDNWVLALQQGVDQAQGMIIVLSPAYTQSKYCRRELNRADNLGYPIIPVLIEPITPGNVPLELQTRQHIDFTQWKNLSEYQKRLIELLDDLKEKLHLSLDQPLSTTPFPVMQSAAITRKVEDDLDETKTRLQGFNAASRSNARRAKTLEDRLDMLEKQYAAAANQYNRNLNTSDLPKLELQMTTFDAEIQKIEVELEQLGKG